MADSATIDIRGDNTDLKKKLEESKSMFVGFGSAISAAAVAAAAAFAVKFVVDWGRQALESFKEAEQAASKLEAVLKATHGAAGRTNEELTKMAGEMQKVTTFGDDMIVNAQAVLATFTKINGGIFDEALVAATDMATVLGGDLQG